VPTISTSVVIPHRPDVVWKTLKDVRTVATCMPGVEVTEELGDGAFKGRLRTKLGAITANFDGEAKVVMENASRSGRIEAKGVDSKGGSRASAEVRYAANEAGGGTELDITAEIKLQGRLAQFGKSGLLQEISNQMVGTFADNLAQRVATGESRSGSEEARMGGVVGRAVWARIIAFFARAFRRSSTRTDDLP
jgi:carbon monoxide dehydrogenase subunit G